MEGRRTRARPKPEAPKRSSSTHNISPTRRSPQTRTRRTSRPRASAPKTAPSVTTIIMKKDTAPSPIKEKTESPSPKLSKIPIAPVSNIIKSDKKASLRTASKLDSPDRSTHSSTVEIRSTTSSLETEINKLADFMRRSASKTFMANKREISHTPTTNTEVESRYSRSASRSVFDDDSKAEFSDDETNSRGGEEHEGLEEEQFKSFNASVPHVSYSTSALGKKCRELEVPREFGGWLGITALMTITPCLVYYLQWCCEKEKCEFKMPDFNNVFSSAYFLKTLFPGKVLGAYFAFQMGVFALSAVVFGRYVYLPTDRISAGSSYNMQYKFNLLPIALLMTLMAGIAEYLQYPVADFVLEHQLQFCLYGFVIAFVVGLWAFIRADEQKSTNKVQPNIYGKSGNFVVDYAQGRLVNPKWQDIVEYKQVSYRAAMLLTLLYAECYLYKELVLPSMSSGDYTVWNFVTFSYQNVRYDSTALLTTCMLLFYVFDAIIFEHHLASSFELQGEGFGTLLLLRYAATPYLLTAVARYFYDHQLLNQSVANTPLVCKYAGYVSVAVLLVGLTLKRWSNAVKYKYRIDPNNPYFNGFDTIHTYQGRRLLLGSLWGKVRQPNYAGDLVALLGLTLPIYLRFAWPPLVSVLLLCVILLHRTKRVMSRNLSRYHSSWVRYSNKVRYFVLPHVY